MTFLLSISLSNGSFSFVVDSTGEVILSHLCLLHRFNNSTLCVQRVKNSNEFLHKKAPS